MALKIGHQFLSLVLFTIIVLLRTGQCARKLEPKGNWMKSNQEDLYKSLRAMNNYGVAKNVILFIGDGLGLPTTHVMRLHKGQKKGNPGEEEWLNYDKFPFVALAKTYETDRQIPESGGTATALMGGVKTRWNLLGLDDTVTDKKCDTVTPEAEVTTILNWAQDEGKSTGVVTTARITHATPGASYAKCPNRDWEDDSKVPADAKGKCKDIALQLIERGQNISVIFGGGRRHLLPNTTSDHADAAKKGRRQDGRNLINEWLDEKKARGKGAKFVWNKTEFDQVDVNKIDFLMGLFGYAHMSYEVDRVKDQKEPSIAEMTRKAIQLLKKNDKGFFLLVEGAKIDIAHHDGLAKKAIGDGLAFEAAVGEALNLTDIKDTLIVVTGDHSHSFTTGGYPPRGNPIFGNTTALPGAVDLEPSTDFKPYTTIQYGNGPGYSVDNVTGRANITGVDTADPDYLPQAAVPLQWETHSGEDVAIYARGPMAHLFHGLHDQSYVAHVMGYASCLGHNKDHCTKPQILRTSVGVTCTTDAEHKPKPKPIANSSTNVRFCNLFIVCYVLILCERYGSPLN